MLTKKIMFFSLALSLLTQMPLYTAYWGSEIYANIPDATNPELARLLTVVFESIAPLRGIPNTNMRNFTIFAPTQEEWIRKKKEICRTHQRGMSVGFTPPTEQESLRALLNINLRLAERKPDHNNQRNYPYIRR